MDILIAYKKNDTVYVGADTRYLNYEDYKQNASSEFDYMIHKTDNDILIGFTTDRKLAKTVFAFPEIFTLDRRGKLNKRHIVTKIIPTLQKLLADFSLIEENEYGKPCMKDCMIIAYKDKLYEITQTFDVYAYEDFTTLGDCSDFTLATLLNASKNGFSDDVMVRALDCAHTHSAKVGDSYIVIDTKNLKFELKRSMKVW